MSIIEQEVVFPASPSKVFHALMDSATHSAFTGAVAEISPDAGGAWSAHGGGIAGRNIEVSDARIVQAWRAGNWPAGVYSVVRFELTAEGDGTRLALTHSGYPEGSGPHLEKGWHDMYWTPLQAFLSA